MVEQLTLNQLVLGSSPSRGTISFFTTFFKNSRAQKVSKTAINRRKPDPLILLSQLAVFKGPVHPQSASAKDATECCSLNGAPPIDDTIPL